mmetsp:Transcript_71551/g.165463  ORF Transcript_71551/g.165463 Transcript_71551/m.165463 type:complete len:221 (-) Transcript_71551:1091-1753(-)
MQLKQVGTSWLPCRPRLAIFCCWPAPAHEAHELPTSCSSPPRRAVWPPPASSPRSVQPGLPRCPVPSPFAAPRRQLSRLRHFPLQRAPRPPSSLGPLMPVARLQRHPLSTGQLAVLQECYHCHPRATPLPQDDLVLAHCLASPRLPPWEDRPHFGGSRLPAGPTNHQAPSPAIDAARATRSCCAATHRHLGSLLWSPPARAPHAAAAPRSHPGVERSWSS